MTPVEVCNIALSEIGIQVRINSIGPPDNSPAAQAAFTNYSPKIRALHRAVNWDFARAQAPLTLWKSALSQGDGIGTTFTIGTSSIGGGLPPPPQPFVFSYLVPSDSLEIRFLMVVQPFPAPTSGGTPIAPGVAPMQWMRPKTDYNFVLGTDWDANNNPIKVIQTNVPQAQAVYTRDLSQFPDAWDSLFLSAATSFLGTYFINALARNRAQLQDMMNTTKGLIDQARASNGNEGILSIDHTPDWFRSRMAGSAWGLGWSGPSQFSPLIFPDGLSY